MRLWLEPREIEGAEPEWRGTIEHVASGEHCAFQKLDIMLSFMTKHFPISDKKEE
jgi:hypothetical protein